jgi:N-acetylglucosaminyl-diphospho-decaprenol L-rhamnosyltransferase
VTPGAQRLPEERSFSGAVASATVTTPAGTPPTVPVLGPAPDSPGSADRVVDEPMDAGEAEAVRVGDDPLTSPVIRDSTRLPYETVIVDNGSTDGSPQHAARRHRARLIETGRNLGYGTAANLGARGCSAPWILVVNPDTHFSAGAPDLLVDAAARWPEAGVLGPTLLTPEGDTYPSARAFPSLATGTGHAIFGWCWPSNPWTATYRRDGNLPEGVTGWLSGACMLLRRQAFEAVGGFDEHYFMYFEDLDLCERLAKAGWACVYVPSAVVTHVGGEATSRVPVSMCLAHHRSALQYLSRRYPAGWQAPLRLALRAGLVVRYQLVRRRLPADDPSVAGLFRGDSDDRRLTEHPYGQTIDLR